MVEKYTTFTKDVKIVKPVRHPLVTETSLATLEDVTIGYLGYGNTNAENYASYQTTDELFYTDLNAEQTFVAGADGFVLADYGAGPVDALLGITEIGTYAIEFSLNLYYPATPDGRIEVRLNTDASVTFLSSRRPSDSMAYVRFSPLDSCTIQGKVFAKKTSATPSIIKIYLFNFGTGNVELQHASNENGYFVCSKIG